MRNLFINRRDYQALEKMSGFLLSIHLFLLKYIGNTLGLMENGQGERKNTFSKEKFINPKYQIVNMAYV